MKKVDNGCPTSRSGIETSRQRHHLPRKARLAMWMAGLALLAWQEAAGAAEAGAAPAAASATSATDGLYAAPSRYCTALKGGQLRACRKRHRDCLLLKTQADGALYFELHSVQANQHVCGINGVAKREGGAYVFSEQDADGGTWRVSLQDTGRQWTVRQVDAPPGHLSPFCGVHASPDGLRFDKAAKQEAEGKVCFKDE